jgi:SAM-dependent methyltransferase
MASYTGKHAEYYDIFYQDKDYAGEAAFVHACLERFSQGAPLRLFEMACGSGNHALQLQQLGYEIVAIDYSEDLLAVARAKAVSRNASIDFRLADMRSLALADEPFDAAICLFDSIGYVQTNAAIQQVLDGVRKHLRPGGLFVFEFWHAAAMLKGYDPVRVRRWPVEGGELLRISSTRLEPEQQLAEVTYDIYDLGADGAYTYLQETQVNRYFLVQEMAAFLTRAGLEPLAWLDGYSWKEDIDENTWHVLAVARRGMD